jgi:hypothetical protein
MELVGSNVTFFTMRDNSASQANRRACGGFKISGNGNINLDAPPNTGAPGPLDDTNYANGVETVLFWQDDRTGATYGPACTESFDYSGGTNTSAGIIYLPQATLNISGGGSLGAVQVIVDKFDYSGNAPFTITYQAYLTPQIPKVWLAE